MQNFTDSSRIIITCSNRLSPWLEKDLQQIGYKPEQIFKTGARLHGSLNDCIRLNLHLRTASQVLYSLGSFTAVDANELYERLLEFPWERIMQADTYFSITSNVSNPTISNNLFANVKVKDAIADRFRKHTGQRPSSGSALQGLVIHLYWKDDLAELFIDTSGETLSKHGYRKIPGKAPMLESLAAATLLAGNWNPDMQFVNPMCGSGTLAIEAAMIATGRTPGLYRNNYSFMHIAGYDDSVYTKYKKEIESAIKEELNISIIATDIRRDAIEISKINAGIAGVEKFIEFEICDFRDTKIPPAPGAVYFNPEYGDRLGEEIELTETYRAMGDFMKKDCQGYWGYIFTGNLELAKKIGLKPKRRIEFFNSKIDCRLMEYELYAGSRESKLT